MSDEDKKVEVAPGIHIAVISDEKAEEVDYLVCAPYGPSDFDDNLKGICCECGIDVMYRWHAPRKPKRICMECLVKKSDEDR